MAKAGGNTVMVATVVVPVQPVGPTEVNVNVTTTAAAVLFVKVPLIVVPSAIELPNEAVGMVLVTPPGLVQLYPYNAPLTPLLLLTVRGRMKSPEHRDCDGLVTVVTGCWFTVIA
jgi:hypothetical protein